MCKLLFFDIDGTLAYPRQSPALSTVVTVRKARSNGHKAFLCTGRTWDSIPAAISEIGFDGGIFSAGGIVRTENTLLAEHFMQSSTAEAILSLLDQMTVLYTLETPDGRFSSENSAEILAQVDMTDVSQEMQDFTRTVLFDPGTRPLSEYTGQRIFKIAYHSPEPGFTAQLTQRLDGTAKVVQFDNIPDLPLTIGEISDPAVNKGRAMLDVCGHYGKTPADCIAFGDSMNDAEILLAAGLGVAMGNAQEDVKGIADMVCDSCENDGIAKALQTLGLI